MRIYYAHHTWKYGTPIVGQWNTVRYSKVVLPTPKTKYQKFVHLCDYLASRKFLEVNFNKIYKV